MLYLANNRLLLINNGNSLYRIDSQTQPEPDMYTIPFTFTIDTTLGSNAGNTFELPLKNQGFNYTQYVYDDAVDDSLYYVPLSYDFIVDWGDGNTDHITTYNDINKTHIYSSNGVYQISILGKCEGWGKYDNLWEYNQLYNDSEKITSIDRWGNCGFVDLYTFCDSCSNLTNVYNVDSSQTFINTYNMFDMFYGCTSLTSLDASNWNVSNVVDMSAMFYGCTSLTTLDVTNWDVTSVLSMGGMFDGDTPLSVTSYDNLLIEFASLSNLTSNIELDANISQYSCAAEEAHDTLTSSPNNWSITDAGLNVASCDGDPFIFTINTTKGTGNSFNLPLRSGFNYDMLVDWGDGSSDVITSYNQTEKLHSYSTGGIYTITITGLCEAWYFNLGGDRLKLTTINQWGDTGFINMEGSFSGCINLTTVDDTDGTWCSNVTTMSNMFYYCPSLTTLNAPNWDVSNVTNMSGMFSSCTSLTTLDVSNWNVSNVANMSSMFYYCPSLTTLDVSNWDVSNVTNMIGMFSSCTSLTTLDVSNWDVSNVTNMSGMFSSCTSLTTLDVSNWNVSNVTDMSYMFSNCTSLQTLDVSNWDVSNVTDMTNMFYGCSSLTTLDVSNWNVSNITNMNSMFENCTSLTTLDVSNWNTINVTDMNSMFAFCSLLTTLNLSGWNVENVLPYVNYNSMYRMFNGCSLSTASYDAALIAWSSQNVQSGVRLDASSKYSSAATSARSLLQSKGWTISDGGLL